MTPASRIAAALRKEPTPGGAARLAGVAGDTVRAWLRQRDEQKGAA